MRPLPGRYQRRIGCPSGSGLAPVAAFIASTSRQARPGGWNIY